MKINEIQKKYLDRIENLSTELGIEVSFSESSKFLNGTISDYRFWVYDTGDSDFSSSWYDRRFEIYDFKDEDEIVNAFIKSLKDAIIRRDHFKEHPEKSPPPIFDRLFDWIKGSWKNRRNEK